MFNIFKKKEPQVQGSGYSSTYSQNPSTVAKKPSSLFLASNPPKMNNSMPQTSLTQGGSSSQSQVNFPSVIMPKSPVMSSAPKVIQGSGYGSNYANNGSNYKQAPVVTPLPEKLPAPQDQRLTSMDSFLKSQQGVADQKRTLAGANLEQGDGYRTDMYNLQQDQLSGMKGSAEEMFNNYERSTLAGLDRVRGAGERNKDSVEDYYGDAQRTAAQVRRETQGESQRRFSNLNTIDSFGEGSFKQANENIDSDFTRVTQQFAKEKAGKLAEIDDQVFSAEQTSEQAISEQRTTLQQTLRQIDSQLVQGTMEYKFAQEQAVTAYQDSVLGIEDWFNNIKLSTEQTKMALENEINSMSSFTPEFMASGVPSNQNEYEFLIKNQEAFGKLYPGLTGSDGLGEKGQIVDLIDNVLAKDTGNITGSVRFGTTYSPQARDTKAVVEQIKAKLAIEERAKLKGQGTITDGEMQMLANAVTKLNYAGSDEAFRNELLGIKGILERQGAQGSGGNMSVDMNQFVR